MEPVKLVLEQERDSARRTPTDAGLCVEARSRFRVQVLRVTDHASHAKPGPEQESSGLHALLPMQRSRIGGGEDPASDQQAISVRRRMGPVIVRA